MKYNEQIKTLLDNIIADISNSKRSYVKNPDKDFTRGRKLPFGMVVKLVLSMKGNTLNKELYDFFGRNPEEIVTSSAFIQQRDKLKEDVFVDLFHRFNESMTDLQNFHSYKLYAVDGSDINIAFDKNADTYMKPTGPKTENMSRGYNQYHLNAIYDLLNRVYVEARLQPKQHLDERRAFIDMLEDMKLQSKTIFIADRGYPSWNMFTHFKYKNNAEYLIRVKNNENNIVKSLPLCEFDIDKNVIISTNQYDYGKDGYIIVNKLKGKQKNRKYKENRVTKPTQWDFADKEELNVRIVRFKITEDTYETIFTSLPRNQFSIDDIKHLYGLRWGIETSFRELKYVIGLVNLHSKKDTFIRQEIFAKLIMYNFCERILSAAVVNQDAGKLYKYQINYTMGMQVCLDFYRSLVETEALYDLVLKYIVPVRPGRSDKRKMKPKTFIYFTYRVAA